MKFRVEREVLAEAVTWVARGLPARPPVPVLAGILIEARWRDGKPEGKPFAISPKIRPPAKV